jgi:uncharacterized protein YdgA (DUF945 family)
MKKGIVTIVVLAILILGGYYGMGMMAENNIRDNIEVINQTPNVKVQIDDYQRGWFSSKAKLTWVWDIPQPKLKPSKLLTFKMPIKVAHGPFIFGMNSPIFGAGFASSKLDIPQEYKKQYESLFSQNSTKPTLNVTLFIHYFGSSDFSLEIPKFTLIPKKRKAQFEWLGLKSVASMSSGHDQVSGNLIVNGMKFTNKRSNATVAKFTSNYDLRKNENGLWLGKANFDFPSMEVTKGGQKRLQVVNFKMSSDSDVAEGLFSSNMKTSLDKVVIDGKDYGPGVIDISLTNLDATVLAEINQILSQMGNAPEQERKMMLFRLMPQIPKLVANGAVLEISKMSFAMPQGKIDANAKVSLPKGAKKNPLMMLQQIEATADIQVPISLVKETMKGIVRQQLKKQQMMQSAIVNQMQQQIPQDNSNPQQQQPIDIDTQVNTTVSQRLAQLIQSGIITQQGQNYSVVMNFSNGKLTINGKPFTPSMIGR